MCFLVFFCKSTLLIWHLLAMPVDGILSRECKKQNMVGFRIVSEHVDDIVTLIFQYINLLQKVSPQEWIFRECQVSGCVLVHQCQLSILMKTLTHSVVRRVAQRTVSVDCGAG